MSDYVEFQLNEKERVKNDANSKCMLWNLFVGVLSVPARVRHCVNPAKDREKAPTKSIQGPLWPFPFLIAWA